jgi:hypothetical protein
MSRERKNLAFDGLGHRADLVPALKINEADALDGPARRPNLLGLDADDLIPKMLRSGRRWIIWSLSPG